MTEREPMSNEERLIGRVRILIDIRRRDTKGNALAELAKLTWICEEIDKLDALLTPRDPEQPASEGSYREKYRQELLDAWPSTTEGEREKLERLELLEPLTLRDKLHRLFRGVVDQVLKDEGSSFEEEAEDMEYEQLCASFSSKALALLAQPQEQARQHDCENWSMEGIACARCNPIAGELREKFGNLDNQEPPEQGERIEGILLGESIDRNGIYSIRIKPSEPAQLRMTALDIRIVVFCRPRASRRR